MMNSMINHKTKVCVKLIDIKTIQRQWG